MWNKERKCVYKKLIEKETKEQDHAIHGNTTFPMVLRVHLDSDIYIERKIVPMNYHVKTNKELVKHLKMVKKNKATGPDNIKGELYRTLGESKICVKTLQKVFQNIIDIDLKIKSWEKSNTRLIPTSTNRQPSN